MQPYETVVEEENPYLPVKEEAPSQSGMHTTGANLTRRNAAILEAEYTNEDLFTTVSRNMQVDPEISVLTALDTAVQGRTGAIDEEARRIVENPAQGDPRLLTVVGDAKEMVRTEYQPSEFERLAVQDSDLSFDDRVRRNIAADDALIRAAAKEIDDQSIFGMALDIGEAFVPGLGSLSKDVADAAKALTGGDASYFNTTEALLMMRRTWSQMSPSQKSAAVPTIMPILIEAADGNVSTAAQFAEYMTLPESALQRNAIVLDKLLDAVDGASIFTGILKVAKGANAVNRLRRLGREDEAAEVAAGVASTNSEEAARAAGLTQPEIAAIEVPYNHEEFFAGLPDGLASSVRNFKKMLTETQATVGQNTAVSRQAIVNNRLKELESRPDISRVEYSRERGSITFTMHREGARDMFVELPIDSKDEWDVLRTTGVGAINANLSAPATKFNRDFDTVVSTLTTGNQLAQKSAKEYGEVLKVHNQTIKKVKGPERQLLDDVVSEGDRLGKEYTLAEIKAKGLTSEVAQEAYFQNRILNNHAHSVKSNQLLDGYVFEGYDKYMSVGKDAGVAARVMSDPVETLQGIPQRSIWSDLEGVSMDSGRITTDMLEKYDAVLVKFRSPSPMRDGKHYTYSVVERGQLRKLEAPDVLPYREGYVTNIHERAKYFVTSPVRGTVDGVSDALVRNKVERAFSSKKKMDAWVKTARGEDGQLLFPTGRLDDQGWVSHFDRDYNAISKNEAMSGMNGLFTGKRSESGLIVDGEIDTRMASPFDAVSKYYQDLANRGILDRYRAEMKQRWLNTYNDKVSPEFRNNFTEGMVGLERAGLRPGTKEYRAAKELHDHIRGASGIKSEDEIAGEHWLRELSEQTEATNKLYLRMSGKSGLSGAMKSIAFHVNLGILNASQLIVQGSGMAVSMGAHPVAFAKAQPKMLMSTLSDASAAPLPKGRVHDLWRASGFRETVDMNADLAKASQSGNTSKFMSIFFTQGELLNRRGAFYTMYEVLKARKGRDLTMDDLAELIGEANRMTLNFSTVNKAKWQNGWLGVLTQFQQVTEKSFNQIWNPLTLGKSPLTGAERAGAMAAQSLMFGLAGVPFGEYVVAQLDKTVADAGMTPEDAEVYKQGVIGLLPIKNNFSNRMSMGQMHGNFYTKLMTGQLRLDGTKLDTLRKGMLGAFGNTVARAIDGAVDISRAAKSGDVNVLMQAVTETAVKLPSSLRNMYIVEAYRSQQMILSSRGKPLSKTEMSTIEQTFAALGFPIQEIDDAFRAQDIIKSQERFMREVVDYSVNAMRRGLDVDNANEWEEGGVMAKMFPTLSPPMRAEAHRRIEKALQRGQETLIERIGEDAISKQWLDNTTNPVINEAIENGTIR